MKNPAKTIRLFIKKVTSFRNLSLETLEHLKDHSIIVLKQIQRLKLSPQSKFKNLWFSIRSLFTHTHTHTHKKKFTQIFPFGWFFSHYFVSFPLNYYP